MPTNQVLYYPYIDVPEDAWFTRVLLYWDKVGSIVPHPFVEQQDQLSAYMQDLMAAGLVTPVVPEAHHKRLDEAMTVFLKFLDDEAAEGESRSGSRPRPVQMVPSFDMHRGKLGHKFAHGLMNRGLATPVQGGDWYEVESRTASHYMAYLATALGAFESMSPITDSPAHLAAFSAHPDSGDAPTVVLEELRASILEDLLPAPSEAIPVTKLVQFKDDYGELLASFRTAIEYRLVDLATIEDEWSRRTKLDLFKGELEDQMDEIRARMEERRWPPLVFGTVAGLVAAAIPGAQALAAESAVAGGLAVPGLIAAMYHGIPELRRVGRHAGAPLAYAALAQRRLRA